MSTSGSFTEQMRRRTGRAKLISSICIAIIPVIWLGGGLAALFLPSSFWGDNTPRGTMIAIGVFYSIPALLMLYFFIYRRRGNPYQLQLRAFDDPQVVVAQIDQDFAGQPFRANTLHLSPRYLCYSQGPVAIVRGVHNLVWAYRERVRRKRTFVPFIPYYTHQLVVWNRFGRAAVLTLGEKRTNEALDSLQAVAPWIYIGYSEAWKESWNHDRNDFIAVVDGRRRQRA